MTNEELAWVAGIVDGEGCIHINRQRAANRQDLRQDCYRLYLKVTMGDKPTLDRILSILGKGVIVKHVDRKAVKDKVNTSWSYLAAARQAGEVLTQLRPHLFTKASEADVALAFLRIDNAPLGGAKGTQPVPQVLCDTRQRAYWRLRQMKPRWRFYKAQIDKEALQRGVEPEYKHYLEDP